MKKTVSLVVVVSMILGLLAFAVFAAPGSSDDPVVSLSYITEVLWPQIKEYVDSSKGNTTGTSSSSGHISPDGMVYADTFKVISIKKGEKLLGGDGCEVIVRTGSVSIIASDRGGISDVTAGLDLPGNTVAPANHLLVIPVNDGRGLLVNSDAYVMVKGDYKIN